MSMNKLVVANWKMNGSRELLSALPRFAAAAGPGVQVAVCPPFPLIALAVDRGVAGIVVGAQDCHAAPCGAHTGAVSAALIAEAGARLVIVGHSERRRQCNESDALVARKAAAAVAAGLGPLICVGEEDEGEDPGTVAAQLRASLPGGAPAGIVVAYEPVWAIGSGRTPAPSRVASVHAALRAALIAALGDVAGRAVPILYGGSVDAANAAAFTREQDVDGVLVGGASLDREAFQAIIAAVSATVTFR
ncbi:MULTISPECIES: triose-phosphate isomerase [Sphingomonadaceae]|jgi:triosephosphate isomerase|uniref:Triosephosphate isomerase n=1 Tax=Sphingomonas pseudosanguinis TaxID=413712 RepID=A0A7W6AFZ6_9SPHN|nr:MULTISPECIES: triose-phosphate isomerase [Sphingomonadaceae]MBB3879881.1 triosephosphate isomerase [Sphingomonas pseudosanguinis]MBN3536844.1 triose-phosphate isomerase [Sphingomonas pseudosanguinis]OMJ30860.1 triose-phosphate isomerase [Sphingomonas sp. Sph1(2015)]CAH0499221.1 Triosephosphate isomerase [Novosphingobium sp. CECT 9465]